MTSRLERLFNFIAYLLIGIFSAELFKLFNDLYVDFFGETHTAFEKLLASLLCSILMIGLVFIINGASLKLPSKRIGFAVGVISFLSLYLFGPGLRAPLTLYLAAVSYPYNVNMLTTLFLPIVFGFVISKWHGTASD